MADAVVRIQNGSESVADAQRIMQGPAYQENERRAATWNATGCGSGLSESEMELVRSKSLLCGRLAFALSALMAAVGNEARAQFLRR